MSQEPKRRHSRARKGKRRASIVFAHTQTIKCPNCGAVTLPHIVCKTCGFYRGKEVVKKEEKAVVRHRTKTEEK